MMNQAITQMKVKSKWWGLRSYREGKKKSQSDLSYYFTIHDTVVIIKLVAFPQYVLIQMAG